MKIVMKPVKGDNFEIDIDEASTVKDLKARVLELRSDYVEGTLKLIHAGKILGDEAVLKDVGIAPDGFVVIMGSKAAPKVAPAPAVGTPAATTPAATPATPATPAAATPAAAAPGAALPSVITDIKGSPRFRELALVVAQRPEALQRMLPAIQAKWPELHEAIRGNVTGFVNWCRAEVAPAILAAMQAQGAQLPPELMQALQQNPAAMAEMQRMIAEGGGEDDEMPGAGALPMGGSLPQPPAQIGPDDEAAIGRLVAMGFDRVAAAQAYFACEKNEELAANFLLSGGDDDDMGA